MTITYDVIARKFLELLDQGLPQGPRSLEKTLNNTAKQLNEQLNLRTTDFALTLDEFADKHLKDAAARMAGIIGRDPGHLTFYELPMPDAPHIAALAIKNNIAVRVLNQSHNPFGLAVLEIAIIFKPEGQKP